MTGRRNAADSGGEKFAPRRIFLTFKSTRILYEPGKLEVVERAFYLAAHERMVATRFPMRAPRK